MTALFGVPLAEQVPVEPDDLVALPYSSGTTGLAKGVMLSHRNLVANIAQVLGPAQITQDETFIAVLPFFHIYGMQVLMNTGLRAGRFVPGSVGLTCPNTEMRVVDPATGGDLGQGEDGELWIRGPQVMRGYLNAPAATALCLDEDGWLHTGDIGHVDADGHVYVVDRLKELIKVSGFQVPPAELEALLLSHPAIADAAVIGRPDEDAGEVPVAYVVIRGGGGATKEELKEFVAGQVAHYKELGEVVFIDAVPKSASGKILRRMLRDSPRG